MSTDSPYADIDYGYSPDGGCGCASLDEHRSRCLAEMTLDELRELFPPGPLWEDHPESTDQYLEAVQKGTSLPRNELYEGSRVFRRIGYNRLEKSPQAERRGGVAQGRHSFRGCPWRSGRRVGL